MCPTPDDAALAAAECPIADSKPIPDDLEVPYPGPAYVVVDTETSGLFRYDQPADADGQPRLAELALIELAGDFSVERETRFLIRPDGWEMNAEAAAIHGLTQERLLAEGVPVAEALEAYNAVLDGRAPLVGYNVSYDLKVMRGELRRAGLPDKFETTKSIDCMRPLVSVCKIPKVTGKGFKFPKLAEAYLHLTGKTLEGAHGAVADARAAAKIFAIAVRTGIITGQLAAGVKEQA
jgi:DNA polymerase III epsilon subunit-like protein